MLRSLVEFATQARLQLTQLAYPDDPQMPGLIPMIRKARPGLPIVYRSHIEIRSDLVHLKGSPQHEVWSYLWDRIKLAGTNTLF
jgi:alpha,alpha-trehalose phosphorylase (configuration-retaining)